MVSPARKVLRRQLELRLIVVVRAEHVEAAESALEFVQAVYGQRYAGVVFQKVSGGHNEVGCLTELVWKIVDPSLEPFPVRGHVEIGHVKDREWRDRRPDRQLLGDHSEEIRLDERVGAQRRSTCAGCEEGFHRVEDTGVVRLSLRWKIAGGYGLLLLLIVILGWVTLSLFGSLRTVQRKIFDQAIPELVAVDEIVRSYTAQSAAVRGYLIGSNPQLVDQFNSEVAIAKTWQEEARRLFRSGRDKALLRELVVNGNRFHDLVDRRVIPLASGGKRSQAFRVLGQKGAPLISRVETLGGLLRNEQDEKVAASETDVRTDADRTIVTLVGVLLGALAIGIVLAVVLPQRLVANISRLVEATRGIGGGDFDQKLDIRSGDEIQELGSRLSEMQLGLKRLQQLAFQDRELQIAASIQQNLLQRSLPNVPGARVVPVQRQANLVGGDWYDVDYFGRTLTVAVGDASGKGIAAALMSTVALTVLRAERRLGAGPKRVVERANRALKEATAQDAFTTLVYATLDVQSGEMRLMNMGHPSPFILRDPGDGAEPSAHYLEEPRNRAVGWFDDPGLGEAIVTLQPGDRLILFTDGWLEAKSATGETYGEHRFAEDLARSATLDADGLCEELVKRVESFSAGKLDDDLTMLVVEFSGADASLAAQDEAREEVGEGQWHSRR
jgi:serine phosphatase RsbU (regulator of sigma subunit)/CHASE3 domain sensor protein